MGKKISTKSRDIHAIDRFRMQRLESSPRIYLYQRHLLASQLPLGKISPPEHSHTSCQVPSQMTNTSTGSLLPEQEPLPRSPPRGGPKNQETRGHPRQQRRRPRLPRDQPQPDQGVPHHPRRDRSVPHHSCRDCPVPHRAVDLCAANNTNFRHGWRIRSAVHD